MKELTITYFVDAAAFEDKDAVAIRATVEVKDLKEAFDIVNNWPHHVIAWNLESK